MATPNNPNSELLHVVDTLDNNRLIALKPLPYNEKALSETQGLKVASESGAASEVKEQTAPVHEDAKHAAEIKAESSENAAFEEAKDVPAKDAQAAPEAEHSPAQPAENHSSEQPAENHVKAGEEPKQLTLEEVEDMDKPAADGPAGDGGFDLPAVISYGQYGPVLSQPTNLGFGFGGAQVNQQVDNVYLPFAGENRLAGINAENDLQVVFRDNFPVYNVTLVLDYSLSMDAVVGAHGETRLQLLQQALAGPGGLLDAYENASSQFTLSIVYFGGPAPGTGTYISQYGTDIDTARSDILNNATSFLTRYDLAMAYAQEDFQIDSNYAYLDNAINRLYFISDGEPTGPFPGDPGSASSYSSWQGDLLSYNIDAYAVSISPISLAHLEQLDNPGDSVIQVASDLSNLGQLLNDTVPVLTGNVMVNDLPPSPFSPTWVFQYAYDSNGDTIADTLGTIGSQIHLQHGDFILFSDGKYFYSPDPNLEDQLINEYVYYSIRDAVNQQDSAILHIQINPLSDDRPHAVNDFQSIARDDLPAYNVTLMLDYSLSMDVVVGTGGETRLELLQQALTGTNGLLSAYQNASSEFQLTIIYYGGPNPAGTYLVEYGNDVNQAISDINSFPTTLGTDYKGALELGIDDFTKDAAFAYLDNFINRAYFISDGAPTTTADYAAWQAAIAAYNVDVMSVSIDPYNNIHLPQIANPGDNPSVIDVANDLSNLEALLVGTVTPITGNVMTNDLPLSSSSPNTVIQFFYDSDNNTSPDKLGTIGTPIQLLHGLFTLNADGSYSYQPNNGTENIVVDEYIRYFIEDTAGKIDDAILHIHVDPLTGPNAVNDQVSIARDDLPCYNLTLLLDYSPSMNVIVGGGKSRLEILQESLTGPNGLLSAYQNASSEIHLSIVYFGSADPVNGTYLVEYGTDVNQAINDINNFSIFPVIGTDYKHALELGVDNFVADASAAYLADCINRAYFISDGDPTTAANYAAWQAAIAAYNVDVLSVSIAPINTNFLPLIANPTDNPLVINVENDLSNLNELLVNTVVPISGNVLTNDVPLSGNPPNAVFHYFYDSDGNGSTDAVGTLGSSIQLLNGKFTLNADGSYSYRPDDGTEHTVIDEYVRYFIADTAGKIDDAVLHIHIDPLSNVGPTAVNDNFVFNKNDLPVYNLTLLLDYSNSMLDQVGSSNETRLQLLQQALTGTNGLLNAYQNASSEVHISIVYFGGSPTAGTYLIDYGTNITQAKSDINSFPTTGGTDYKSALELAIGDFQADANNNALVDAINRAYFISDGAPTNTADYDAWQAAIAAYNIDVSVLSIAPFNNNVLPLIANPDDDPKVIQVANDLSNLNQLLLDTVVTISGDITANDSANGNPPLTVVSYFYDSVNNGYADTLGTVGSSVDLLYGSLLLNADGTFEYKRFQGNENVHIEENIRYTIQDANGNIDDAIFHLEINPNATVPPIILDLDGNGLSLISLQESHIFYDFNQDGSKEHTAWVGPNDGILAYDINGDHLVNNASEFVLTNHHPEAKTDLEALRMAFDSNHDGVFDLHDQQWSKFGVWQDANQNGISDQGEFKSLDQMGIVAINLMTDGSSASPIAGNTVHGMTSFIRADGSQGAVGDVALSYEDIMTSTQILNESSSVNDSSAANSNASNTDAPVAVYVPAHEETQMATAEHVAA